MTDIFISYAREDGAFVSRLVPALEAEGFSVWWDHTIPPGRSWDDVIAKRIEEARCCVVIWSKDSVTSDWVREEATIAKDARKLLPAQIDRAETPVGFRRIQAANLIGWSGDRRNLQWQMLVQEARAMAEPGDASSAAAQKPREQSQPSTRRKTPALIVGALALTCALAAGAWWFAGRHPPPATSVQANSEQASAQEEASAPLNSDTATAPAENPAAVAAAPANPPAPQPEPARAGYADLTGSQWFLQDHWGGEGVTDAGILTFEANGALDHIQEGSMPMGRNTWTQSGARVAMTFNLEYSSYDGEFISQNTMRGTMTNVRGVSGTWRATRQR